MVRLKKVGLKSRSAPHSLALVGSLVQMRSIPNILSIFYAEFDTIQGPRLVFQVPENVFKSSDFDSLCEYIIPKMDLCGRYINITVGSFQICGLPVAIEDPKYDRNCLLFNLCFVFNADDDTSVFEGVVRKMSRELTSLELESEYMSNFSKKIQLRDIIEQIYNDLNTYFESQISVGESNRINLKVIKVLIS